MFSSRLRLLARCMSTTARATSIEKAYALARERFAEFGVNTDAAVKKALATPISMHCWQADDVAGLMKKSGGNAGIQATGNYPGRARNGDELRADYEKVLTLVPGTHRVNLHACYAETEHPVDMDALEASHFSRWMDWAQSKQLSLDFNPTFFAHPKASDGYTLSHVNPAIREFWIAHGVASRRIAQEMAKRQGNPCVINHWIPDGDKDLPGNRWVRREFLTQSLDEMLVRSDIDPTLCMDFVEPKLFGIGSEEYVVGSAEFYTLYAQSRNVGLCLDMGHFHPTELIHDKISAQLQFQKRLLIHVSRPIRWDSDHVVIFNDELRAVFQEIQRGNAWDRVSIALDYFDASINRIAAYVIGLRATRKAVLSALLEPTSQLNKLEVTGDRTSRLALMESAKSMPLNAVWDYLCMQAGVSVDGDWIADVKDYEANVTSRRN